MSKDETVDDLTTLLKDVVLGRPAPPDESPERAALRRQLEKQVAEIKAKGGIVDF